MRAELGRSVNPWLAGVGALAGLGAGCIAYGALIERNWFDLRRETVPVLQSFAAMAAWAALLLPINLLLWRRGLRHYSAMGA